MQFKFEDEKEPNNKATKQNVKQKKSLYYMKY